MVKPFAPHFPSHQVTIEPCSAETHLSLLATCHWPPHCWQGKASLKSCQIYDLPWTKTLKKVINRETNCNNEVCRAEVCNCIWVLVSSPFLSFLLPHHTSQQGPPKLLSSLGATSDFDKFTWASYRVKRGSIKRGSWRGMKDVCRGEEGWRANMVENTGLGRMLLSLSCFVNRWRCNCTLDLYCSCHSPLPSPRPLCGAETLERKEKEAVRARDCVLMWKHFPLSIWIVSVTSFKQTCTIPNVWPTVKKSKRDSFHLPNTHFF